MVSPSTQDPSQNPINAPHVTSKPIRTSVEVLANKRINQNDSRSLLTSILVCTLMSPSSATNPRTESSSYPLPRGDTIVLVIPPIDFSWVACPGTLPERFAYGRWWRQWLLRPFLKLRPVTERGSCSEVPRSEGCRIRSRSQRGSFENKGRMPMRQAALKYMPHSTAVQEKGWVAPVWGC